MAFESFVLRYLHCSFQIFAGPVGFIGADILVVYVAFVPSFIWSVFPAGRRVPFVFTWI